MNSSMESTASLWVLILGALAAMAVIIALVVVIVLLVKRRKENKIRSYRVDLEHFNSKAAKELLLQGKSAAQALQNAREAGLIPGGYRVVSVREVGKDGRDLAGDAATAAAIASINNVANQNMPHLW